MSGNGPEQPKERLRRRYPVEIGDRHGALVIQAKAPKHPSDPKSYWVCKCDCGETKTYRGTDLAGGKLTSCGCRMHSAAKTSATMMETTAPEVRQARARAGGLAGLGGTKKRSKDPQGAANPNDQTGGKEGPTS